MFSTFYLSRSLILLTYPFVLLLFDSLLSLLILETECYSYFKAKVWIRSSELFSSWSLSLKWNFKFEFKSCFLTSLDFSLLWDVATLLDFCEEFPNDESTDFFDDIGLSILWIYVIFFDLSRECALFVDDFF